MVIVLGILLIAALASGVELFVQYESWRLIIGACMLIALFGMIHTILRLGEITTDKELLLFFLAVICSVLLLGIGQGDPTCFK